MIARRERIMMLEPLGKGILGTALRYGSEVRGEDDRQTDYLGRAVEIRNGLLMA